MTFVALASAILSAGAAQAQSDARSAEFDAYVAQAVKDWQAPGLAVSVVKDGRVVFAKGYGVREVGKAATFDTSTVSAIASTTKAITAAAMGILVDEGKLTLELRAPRVVDVVVAWRHCIADSAQRVVGRLGVRLRDSRNKAGPELRGVVTSVGAVRHAKRMFWVKCRVDGPVRPHEQVFQGHHAEVTSLGYRSCQTLPVASEVRS